MIRPTLIAALALAACEAGGGDRLAVGRDEPAQAKPSRAGRGGPRPEPGPAGGCPLEIRFGSYAMGIDRPTLEAVEALLAGDPAVESVERHPWGREGEVTLCARVASDEEAARLHGRVAALFPPDPRGPLSVSTRGGLAFHSPPRER